MLIRDFLLILLALGLVTSCATERVRSPVVDEAWVGELVAYKKAVSRSHGIVGYVKVFDYRQTGYDQPYRVFHVYDLEFEERGILTPMGTGHKIVKLPREVARVKGTTREEIPLAAQPLALNVARCLDIAPDLALVDARPEDALTSE